MTWLQDMRYIVAPLATRVSLPAWIGLTLGVLKDSALVLWLGADRTPQSLSNACHAPAGTALHPVHLRAIYFLLSFPIARLGGYLERRCHPMIEIEKVRKSFGALEC